MNLSSRSPSYHAPLSLSSTALNSSPARSQQHEDDLLQEKKVLSVEEAFAASGGFGRFQWIYSALLIVAFSVHGYIPYTLSYLLLMPSFSCRAAGDPDASFYSCAHSDFFVDGQCNPAIEFVPDMEGQYSLYNWAVDMELYCTSKMQIGLFGSLYFVGFMLGSVTLLRFADVLGRRPIYLFGLVLHLISMCMLIFLNGLIQRYLGMALLGVSSAVTVNVTFMIILELAPAKNSNLLGGATHALDASSLALCTFYLTMISRHWLGYQYWGLVLSVAVAACTLKLPETPHFLCTAGKYEEARAVFRQISAVNGVRFREFLFDREAALQWGGQSSSTLLSTPVPARDSQKASLGHIFANHRLRTNLVLMAVCWAVASFGYYMVMSYQKYIKGDIFVNNALGSAAEPISYIVSSLMLRWVSMKRLMGGSFLISLVFAITLVSDSQGVVASAVFLTRLGGAAAFNYVYLANQALFPPMFLGTCFGVCNFGARFVTIFAPLVAEVGHPYPAILFLVLNAFAGCCAFFVKFPKKEQECEEKCKEQLIGDTMQD